MELKLPELGEGVHEGELIKWRVKEGETVRDDQPLCDIMTDKATMELPSPFGGKVTKLLAKEGDVIKVGQDILSYESSEKSASAPAKAAAQPSAPAPSMAVAPLAAAPAAPSTRRFARESGVDLSRVPASGPGGRVMREDVERYVTGGGSGAVSAGVPSVATTLAARAPLPLSARGPSSQPSQQREERAPFRGLRKKIAEKMRQSMDHAAHFTYVEEADATELVRLREQAKEIGAQYGVKVTYLPFVMKAMVAALRKFPSLNSSLDEAKGELVTKHYYNIGLSVQTEDGLTAPVVKDVASKSILELARDIQDLVERARTKKLTLEDLKDGTITLTNAGSIGGLFATPVINYPEVAILGFNKIFRKPVARVTGGREEVVVRDWTYFSISLDHRIVDGAVGAEFMKLFIRYIETPSLLLLENL